MNLHIYLTYCNIWKCDSLENALILFRIRFNSCQINRILAKQYVHLLTGRFALTKNSWILKIKEIRMKFVDFGNLISNSFLARFFGQYFTHFDRQALLMPFLMDFILFGMYTNSVVRLMHR